MHNIKTNMSKKIFTRVVFPLFIIVLTSGWGFLVHRTVAQLAIYQLPKPLQAFFYTNKDSIVVAAPRPDQRRITNAS